MWYIDSDEDGFGNPNVVLDSCFSPEGYVANSDDCNDANANIYPGAVELCNNADDDCSGVADDNIATQTYYQDLDEDNYGNPDATTEDCSQPNGYVQNSLDCDDQDASVNPASEEILDDGIDQDCDGEDAVTSVDELTLGEVKIFPNPALNELNVSFEKPLTASVIIYDSLGKEVLKVNVVNENSVVIEVESLAAGSYTIMFSHDVLTSSAMRLIIK